MATDAPTADDLLTRMNSIAPPSSGQPLAPAASSSAPSSDDLLTRMNAISPPTQAAGASGGEATGSWADALQASTYRGLADVVNAPSAWFGWKPLIDTNALLAPSETQAEQAHPWIASGGRLFGQAVGTAPLLLAAPEAAAFEGIGLGGNALGQVVARGAITGAGLGAAGNLLTAGEDPQQGLVSRAISGAEGGALLGGVLGGVASKVGGWLGPNAAAVAGREAGGISGAAPAPGPLPEAVTTNLLSPELRQRMAAGPAAGPTSATNVPTPAGAQATPFSAAMMTPEEIATQRTVADKQWLNRTQQPGITDTTEYIPGITTNLVEQEQSVQRARELKDLKNLNPALSQNEREILDINNNIRQGYYGDTVGSEVTRAADLKAANDKINTDLAKVWRGKGEADPANVQAQIKTELAGSAGDLPPLKSAMKQVSDSLENAGTDPEAMYRTHRLINYLQSRQGQIANPGYGAADVQAALTRVKAKLADTIEGGASGFKQAMSDYASARGPIDAAKALQERENGLYDGQGRMQFLPVHRLLRDIIEAQKWDAPSNPLAGVSDAQMMRLKNLHDDLKRVASAKDLAAAAGSDTAMNLVGIAKQYAKGVGGLGVQGAANLALGPGIGSLAVQGVRSALNPLLSARAARQQMQRGMQILRPPPSNPLSQ